MGIEQFFSSIHQNVIINKDIITERSKDETAKKIDTHILCIDFNSIIHVTSVHIINTLNKILYRLIIDKPFNEKLNMYIKEYHVLDYVVGATYDTFKKHMTEEVIETIIKNAILDHVYDILGEFITKNKLEVFQIAIDGVPAKSKMMEQKKRRYMGYIVSDINKHIFKKYESELKKDFPQRLLYENIKISWSKSNISPGTKFMDKLDYIFNSSEFKKKIKEICPNMHSYIYSGPRIHGEGEKKIVEYIMKNQNNIDKKFISIYSPDSDMTVLGLLLNSLNINNITLIRHNQQTENYDIVDIDELSNNIYNYIQKKHTHMNKNNIIADITFIFTIFGNDFIPKIESINVRQDFTKIIDAYIDILPNDKYLIEKINNKNKLNYDVLLSFIKKIQEDEYQNLQKNYMASHYRNYDKIKKILDADNNNFTEKLNNFLTELRKLNETIKTHNYNSDDDYKNIIDNDFLEKLASITSFDNNEKIDNIPIFLKKYIIYYKRNHRPPYIKINFQHYSHSINDKYHEERINQKYLFDPTMNITEYDRELYKFENMLDEYKVKLNAQSLDLGVIKLDSKNYVLKADNLTSSIAKYYAKFFDIDDININNPKMYQVVKDYLIGLLWVFEYYYNNQINDDYVFNFYYYKNHRAPLLKEIYHFLKFTKNDIIDITSKQLNEYKGTKDKYFNQIEHMIYVSPFPTVKVLLGNNSKIEEISKVISNTSINIDSIVDEIWNKQTNDTIDCFGVKFLTKCSLKINITSSKESDIEFIEKIRKIELSKEFPESRISSKSSCLVENDDQINSLDDAPKRYNKLHFPKTNEIHDVRMSKRSVYSTAFLYDGAKTAELIKQIMGKNITISDVTANVGGNTLHFSKVFSKVIANEYDIDEYNRLIHNMSVYNCNNIEFLNKDYTEIYQDIKQDVIFIDPPWGGPLYKTYDKLKLCLSNQDICTMINTLLNNKKAKLIVLKAPSNVDVSNLKFDYKIIKFIFQRNELYRLYFIGKTNNLKSANFVMNKY